MNESLPQEIFDKLFETNDLKIKEFLLENPETPTNILEKMLSEKDIFLKVEALKHPNLGKEKLSEVYKKIKKDDRYLLTIASNVNATKEILQDICVTSKDREVLQAAISNKNHPRNNPFVEPEKGDGNKLYKRLLLETDLRKTEIVKMFNEKLLFADKNGNAIFPIRDENGEIVGSYALDINNPSTILTLNNSKVEDRKNSQAYILATKFQNNIYKEELFAEMER